VAIAVTLHPGSTVNPTELLDFCNGKIPHFAIPRYVRFMNELPKNHAQRVQKFKLRDEGLTPDIWDRESVGYVVQR
jgi:crotonobetaine/carnitine-CoA ligase